MDIRGTHHADGEVYGIGGIGDDGVPLSWVWRYTLDLSTAADEVDLTPSRIYPSPARDHVYLDATETDHTVFDMSGRALMSIPAHTTMVDVGHLATGAYLICTESEIRSCHKWIKQ